jgi:hypothetical protein
MQRVLSKDLWKQVRASARNARQRKAAIAYVTRDLIGLRKGDILILDASERAIKFGETNASLLRQLLRKGVQLYHCADLHAKVIQLDNAAVVGSGNMSSLSEGTLVEAGILTNHTSTVAGVASFIEQLVRQSKQLDRHQISLLCKIKVVPHGHRNAGHPNRRKTKIARLGNRTWLIGVRELRRDPPPTEQRLIDRAINSLQARLNQKDLDPSWLKWGVRGRFPLQCREGDSVIQIWRSRGAKRPSVVMRASPVLLKQKTNQWTRFYLEDPTDRYAELRWGSFKRLLKELGYTGRVSAGMVREIDSDLADAIDRKWKAAHSK